MKLYNFSPSPNGRRVNVFLKEKKIKLEVFELNVREDEQFKEPFNSMNPFNCVPFLELDNGEIISESVSVCRYLEELFPEPSLFGSTGFERAQIDMWNRRLELDALGPLGNAVRNKLPFFAGKVLAGTRNSIEQNPEIVDRGIQMAKLLFERIDSHLGSNQFVAGSSFSIADITGFFVFFAAITWTSGASTWNNYVLGDTVLGAIEVKTWWARAGVPAGCALFSLRFLTQLCRLVVTGELYEETASRQRVSPNGEKL